MKLLTQNFGFTLVELMVVVSIITLLSTIGLVVYTTASKTAKDAKRKADVEEIRKALEQYVSASVNSTYPTSPPSLYTSSLNSPTYFSQGSMPTDPQGNNYNYYFYDSCASSPGITTYVLCSTVLELPSGNRNSLPSGGVSGDNSCPPSPISNTSNGNYYCVGHLYQ